MLAWGLVIMMLVRAYPVGAQDFGQGGYPLAGEDHPWAPGGAGQALFAGFDPALMGPGLGSSPGPGHGHAGAYPEPFSSHIPYGASPGGFGRPGGSGWYGSGASAYGAWEGPVRAPLFEPWTPDFPGAPNPLNTRSGGNPEMGFWEAAPTAFRYRRVPVTGGPSIYAHGWYTPWGEFEGVLIIRGNARGLSQGHGY